VVDARWNGSMDWPQTRCDSEKSPTLGNGTSKERRRNRFATRLTLPCAHRLVGLRRNLLHLESLPTRVVEVARTRRSGFHRRPSSHLPLQSSPPAVETTGFPGPSTHCSSPPPEQTKRPLPRALPLTSVTRTHRAISFRPWGFSPLRRLPPLRSRGHVASRTRPGVRHVARCSHLHRSGWAHRRDSRDASPFEELPSQSSVSCRQGRFPLAVQLRRAPPGEVSAMPPSR